MAKPEINRAVILLIFSVFASSWVLINSQKLVFAAAIYIALPLIIITLYRQWDLFGNKGKLEGIGKNWIRHSFYGILAAGCLISLSAIFPGISAIGLPNVQSIAGTVGRFIIIVIAAPIGEELFFRELILDFFESKLKSGFFIAALISSVLFGVFHFTAYGGSLQAAQGSFVTVGLVGMGFAYLNKFTKSHATNIAAHMTLNAWIGFINLAVIVG